MSASIVPYRERHGQLGAALAASARRIESVLPSGCGLTVARMCGIVMDATVRDPKLLECHIPTIVTAVIKAAEVGLELASPFGEAYLVPFWHTKNRRKEAQMIPGYKGLIKLALASPNISLIEARIVREGDHFEYKYGTTPFIDHTPQKGDATARAVTFAYAIADVRGARATFEVMDRSELDVLRKNSKSKDYKTGAEVGPWKEHTSEMYRKCPTRKLMKTLDLSEIARKAIGLDNESFTDTSGAFESGRGDALKDKIAGKAEPVTFDAPADAEFEEEPGS